MDQIDARVLWEEIDLEGKGEGMEMVKSLNELEKSEQTTTRRGAWRGEE